MDKKLVLVCKQYKVVRRRNIRRSGSFSSISADTDIARCLRSRPSVKLMT